jgi:predicted Na+-dependent transporter
MMRLTCNIDRKGRRARALSGLIFLIIAAGVLGGWIGIGAVGLRWTVGLVLAALGAFQIFEALAGWCIARALGFKTPM